MRVQIPAYTDRWMMGDRYGTVVSIRVKNIRGTDNTPRLREIAFVKLDKSGKTFSFLLDDCTVV